MSIGAIIIGRSGASATTGRVAGAVSVGAVDESVTVIIDSIGTVLSRGRASTERDAEITGAGGSIPAAHLDQVGAASSDWHCHGRAEVGCGASIVVTGETGRTCNRAACSTVVDDEDGVIHGTEGSTCFDSGCSTGAGGVFKPDVSAHVGVTISGAVEDGVCVVDGKKSFAYRRGICAVIISASATAAATATDSDGEGSGTRICGTKAAEANEIGFSSNDIDSCNFGIKTLATREG